MIRFRPGLYFILLVCLAELAAVPLRAFAGDTPEFIDVRSESGIYQGNKMGHVAAWGDYNGDGWQDIVLSGLNFRSRGKSLRNKKQESAANKTKAEKNRSSLLFVSSKGAAFSEASQEAALPDLKGRAAAWADYNNDGLLDLSVVTIVAGKPPLLFRNSKKFSFADVSQTAGLSINGPNANQVMWVDFDNDGWVDLFQAGTGGSLLYRNDGKGGFKDVSGRTGTGSKLKTNGAVWFDSNNDGFKDLFMANTGPNKFYLNGGDGTFADVTDKSGLSGDPGWKTSAACTGDYNSDGFIDLYITNIGRLNRNALYRNNGDGTFTDVTSETGTADAGDGRTCAFVDFDADGDLDIFSTNHVRPNKLFRNSGGGPFIDVAAEAGLASPIDVFSATWADYNRDGYIDVFLNGHMGASLMKNKGNANNSITLKLEGDGKKTNRSAIGTRVKVSTPESSQVREVSGGRGCCEQDMLPLYFGLSDGKSADIEVTWTSGKVCSFKGVTVEKVREYTISEAECGISPSS